MKHHGKSLGIILALLLLTHCALIDAKRITGSGNRKTSSSGSGYGRQTSNGEVTKPSYNSGSGSSNAGSSHSDLAKLSYSNYNAQPPPRSSAGSSSTGNAPPIGWKVPQGPPPDYSAKNPVGGAKPNVHESPPPYNPPPSYGGSNVHTPITATHAQGVQSGYPQQAAPIGNYPAGATYHSSVPSGATYYPAPMGGSYYPSSGQSHYPGGIAQPPTYYHPSNVPAGATFLPAGAALPSGATMYSQPPSSSSGLGFGSGLAAGAIGGAILGHVLTPTDTKVIQQAPPASGGDGKIVIINNGPPGSVTTTDAGSGTTVITTGAAAGTQAGHAVTAGTAAAVPGTGGDAAAPAVPVVPLAPLGAASTPDNTTTMTGTPQQPPSGGIICVPVRVNETDPNDSSKMIEVEKVACYPAPPPQPDQPLPPAGAGMVGMQAPLAPINAMPGQVSQQVQQQSTQATLLPENSSMRAAGGNGVESLQANIGLMIYSVLTLIYAFGIY